MATMTYSNLVQTLRCAWSRITGNSYSDNPGQPAHDRLPEKPESPSGTLSSSGGDEILASALARLDTNEYEQYLAMAKFIEISQSLFLYELMPFKQVLTTRLPLRDAFEVFRALLKLPESETIEYRPVRSLRDVSAQHAIIYRETAASGTPFTVYPPRVVGKGDQRPLACVTRSLFFACLADARVRGRSAFIEFQGAVLLDFQGQELDRVDEQLQLDLPILQASKEGVWITTSQVELMELDEAFMLLGPNTLQFGHWIWEYMPKYVAATMSAAISGVPVLIDSNMPESHRQFLRLVVPAGTEIVEVPTFMSVRVRRLWCAPTLSYVALYLKSLDPLWPTYQIAPPDRFAAVFREMWRRMEQALSAKSGPERIFLARKPDQHRKLVNNSVIELAAQERGFVLVYPQDLDFADQMNLVRNARRIVGSEGSALFLGFFASPGTKLCILSSPHMFYSTSYTCLLEELGVDVTILTGPVVQERPPYPHFGDYSVPEDTFRTFLEEWSA
jgi:glycosyl transferase family 61